MTPAQLDTLVKVSVWGGRRHAGRFERGITGKTYRPATLATLEKAGLITQQLPQDQFGSVTLAVTATGDAVLAEHADAVAAETIRRDIYLEHRISYEMYSRGNHPIAGWGRAPMGCRVSCTCGWTLRVNEGRKDAEGDARFHLFDNTNEALTAAGFPEDELDF